MDTTPLVSIIIPVYNTEMFLKETLISVMNQTYKNIEVICVDDGSTDTSCDIIQDFIRQDSRFRLERQQNQYAGVARNRGMEVASGKYYLFLDSDDIFDKKLVELLVNRAESVGADVVICGADTFTESVDKRTSAPYCNNLLPLDDKADAYKFCPRKDATYNLYGITTPAPWNKLFKASFIRKHGLTFAAHKSGNDLEFVLTALTLADVVSSIPNPLVYYRNHTSSISHNSQKNPELHARAWLLLKERLERAGVYHLVRDAFRLKLASAESWHFYTINRESAQAHIKRWKEVWEPIFDMLGKDVEYLRYNVRYHLFYSIFSPYVTFVVRNFEELALFEKNGMLQAKEAPFEVLIVTDALENIPQDVTKTGAWQGMRIMPVILPSNTPDCEVWYECKRLGRGQHFVQLQNTSNFKAVIKFLNREKRLIERRMKKNTRRSKVLSGRAAQNNSAEIKLNQRQTKEIDVILSFFQNVG